FAMRVPTPNVSVVDLVAFVEKSTTVEEVNKALEAAAKGTMKGILGIETAELVSSDYRGDSRSSIVDAPLTRVVADNCVKVIAWYDNEWGYSCRVRDLIAFMAKKGLSSGRGSEGAMAKISMKELRLGGHTVLLL